MHLKPAARHHPDRHHPGPASPSGLGQQRTHHVDLPVALTEPDHRILRSWAKRRTSSRNRVPIFSKIAGEAIG